MNRLSIFVSSTTLDLGETRKSVLKFLSVLKSNILSMEFFGSDESAPKDFCLEKVRQCNFFVGIYAERYGFIDPETKTSITELEYLEAFKMLEEGKLQALLIYVIDPDTTWPLNFVDRDPKLIRKLKSFKDKISKKHTVTYFNSAEELPFQILKDVIEKLNLEIKNVFKPKKSFSVVLKNTLTRPVGMEFYTEEWANLFRGRTEETNQLLDQVINNKMSLLIGGSGIGKTSLLNAGLLPILHKVGWRTAIIRPLTEPTTNLVNSLWSQLLVGRPPESVDFSFVTSSVATAFESAPVLIIIDQFEDVLGAKASSDKEHITRSLIDIYKSGNPNIRFLISYRGDFESEIGPIWQKVSGSTDGLPRTYLGPLSRTGCKEVLSSNLKAIKISLNANKKQESENFLSRVTDDLISESLLNGYTGVYPPFIQIVLSRIADDAVDKIYNQIKYDTAGNARKIISDYLLSQLKYLGKNESKGREILISLVSAYGVKTQKTIEEIAHEVFQTEAEVEKLIRSLIDLRMVRAINEYFEIVHDFLAKAVLSELTSTDEREAKKFKDLLTSRAFVYEDTKALLARTEYLHIYKYRNKIQCSEQEIHLLLNSYFTETKPIFYWLRYYPKEIITAWILPLLKSNPQQIDQDEFYRNIYRLLIKLGNKIELNTLVSVFSGWKEKSELEEFIVNLATREDTELLIKLSGRRRFEIQSVSQETLVKLISLSDEQVLEQLCKKPSKRHVFENVSLNITAEMSIQNIRKLTESKEKWKKLLAVYGLGENGTNQDLVWLEDLLQSKTTKSDIKIACVKSILRIAWKLKKKKTIELLLQSEDKHIKVACADFSRPILSGVTLKNIIKESNYIDSSTAWFIKNSATAKDLPILKKALKKPHIGLKSNDDLILAICKFGGENDFDFLFDYFLKDEQEISAESAILSDIANLAGPRHYELIKSFIESEDFGLDKNGSQYSNLKFAEHLANPNNVYFIKWLTGVTYAKLAGKNQYATLRRLLKHPYWTVRHAAADAILKFAEVSDFPILIEDAIAFKDNQDAILKLLYELDEKFYPLEK